MFAPSSRIMSNPAMKTSLSLVALLAVGSCEAVQPKPQCKAQPADYAARYFDPKIEGSCDGKVLTGEVLHVQTYVPKRDNPKDTPKIAIEPALVADAIHEAEEHQVSVEKGSEYSLAKYTSVQPDDEDICRAPKFMQETSVRVAEIPGDASKMPPVEPIPARDYKYEWSDLKMLVHPLSNAIHFGAKLVRTEGDCKVTYKVSAVYPALHCGDGTQPVLDENDQPVKDDKGNVLTEPDPTTGKPDPELCKPIRGSGADVEYNGLSPDLEYECDEETLLCLPTKEFPALK